jgi:hypothetical protein
MSPEEMREPGMPELFAACEQQRLGGCDRNEIVDAHGRPLALHDERRGG